MLSVAASRHRAGWLTHGGWHASGPCTVVRFQRVARQQQTVLEDVPIHLSTSDIPGTIHVQLEYYQLLSLPRFAAASSVQQSYQRLLEDDKDFMGYSEKTFYTKQVYLRAAYGILSLDQERRSYDTNLRQHGTAPLVPVSVHDLPGVVALLRACGNPAASYSVSRAALADPSLTDQLSQQDCKDLALAGAIAALDMAVDAAPGGSAAAQQAAWGASQAYTALQYMVEALQEYRVAGPVLHQVQQVQQDLAAAFVLEELTSSSSSGSHRHHQRHPAPSSRRTGSPGGAQEGQGEAGGPRAMALDVLQELLWSPAGALLAQEEQEDLMAVLRGRLASTEQVALFEAAPKAAALPPQQLYDAAMALAALGYTSGSSAALRQAQQLLVTLKGMGVAGEVARDLACCSAMLGDATALRGMVTQSLQQRALSQRLFPGSSADQQQQRPSHMDPPHGGSSGGPGSGQVEAAMDAAVAGWLQEQVLPRFPDTTGLQADVPGWREALARQRGLAGDVHHLLHAARATSPQAGAHMVQLLGRLMTNLRQLMPGAAAAAAADGTSGDQLVQPTAPHAVTAQERARAAVQGMPIGGATGDWEPNSSSSSDSRRGGTLPRYLGAAALVVAAGVGLAWGAGRRSSGQQHGVGLQPLLQQLRPAPSRPSAPTAAAADVGGWQGQGAAATGGQAGSGPVRLAGAFLQQLAAGLPRFGGQPQPGGQTSSSMAAAAQQAGLSVEVVQQLLQRWHTGRCMALGASHKVERLRGLVTAPTLAAYQEEAAALKQGGRYCEVTLQDLHLLCMEVASLSSTGAGHGSSSSSLPDFPRKADAAKGSALRVKGTIREGCRVYEGGRLLHSCTNSIMLEVLLVRSGGQGSWQVEEVKPLPSVMWYAMPC